MLTESGNLDVVKFLIDEVYLNFPFGLVSAE